MLWFANRGIVPTAYYEKFQNIAVIWR